MRSKRLFTVSVSRPKVHSSRLAAGFTMIEMLIVITIVSLLAGVAVTGMQPVIQRFQSENTLSNLRKDLVFSRGEAIKRGGWVGFCGTENRTSCSTSLQKGWLVFHDIDRDQIFNNDDTILSWTEQEHASLNVGLEELANSTNIPVMFNYRGYPDRSVVIRSQKGEVNQAFTLQKTGGLKSL